MSDDLLGCPPEAPRRGLLREGRSWFAPVILAAAFASCSGPAAVGPPVAAPLPPPGATAAPRAAPAAGQAGSGPQVVQTPDFVALVVRPGETLAALAGTWLNDPARAWEIAEYNEIDEAVAGQEIVIPLRPFRRGGLFPEHYQTVPVLVYHQFAEKSTNRMTVSRESFEAQMRLLRDKGYHVVSLEQLIAFVEFRGQLPEKSVVITIDDGWRSAYDIAFPILKKYGYPATLFVSSKLISAGAKVLTWDQLREMAAQGFTVECHSVSHRNFTLPRESESTEQYFAEIQREIDEATRTIEAKLGRRPTIMAYPYGDTNVLAIALLRRQGYRAAFTVVRESNSFFTPSFHLNRSMIFGDYDLAKFEMSLVVTDRKALR